jgi:hypothetical protein
MIVYTPAVRFGQKPGKAMRAVEHILRSLAAVLIVAAIVALSLWGLSAFTPGGKATDQPLPEDEADSFAILPAQHFLGAEVSTSRGGPALWSRGK